MELISAADLAMFRADAESEMSDTLTIRAKSTLSVMNPETGVREPVPGAVQYVGKGKIQERDVQERDAQGGAHSFVSVRQEIHIPVEAKSPGGAVAKIVAGDVVTIEDCPNDPSNNGRIFRVAAPQGKSKATAQRLQVDEIVG
jgi:hypothetical protein